jgi:hypothetical protein
MSLLMQHTPIIEATKFGDIASVRRALADGAILDLAELNSALFIAVEFAHPEIVRLLLSHGADVNTRDEVGTTPLHLAIDVEVEHSKYLYDVEGIEAPATTELSQILLEHGADTSAKTERGETPLQWAVKSNHEAGVKMLQEHGAGHRAIQQRHAPERE